MEDSIATDQKIDFCTTPDGVKICYAISGSGPPLVKAPNWLTHVQYEWQSPVWKHMWEALSRDFTLIRFDQRGSGLSDRNVKDQSFEAWVRDLETVTDAIGLDRFNLLGISQGGAVAAEYAVRHPERVDKMVLYGTFARGFHHRGDAVSTVFDALKTLAGVGWGSSNPAYRQVFTTTFIPDATQEQQEWFNELERISSTPENAVRLFDVLGQMNVVDRLPMLEVPTLVAHVRQDKVARFEYGEEMATLIPGARFVPLEGRNHLILENEPALPLLINELRSFLGVKGDDIPVPTISPSPADLAAPYAVVTPLTDREVEVLKLVASGASNQQIADALFISINTVANHVKNILSKTGTSNRTEATAYAIAQGLAGPAAVSASG